MNFFSIKNQTQTEKERIYIIKVKVHRVGSMKKKKRSSNKTEECVGEIRTESTKKKGSHTCRTGVPSKTGFSFSFSSNIHIYYSAGYKFRRLRVLRSNVCLRIYIQDNGRIESFLDKSDGNRSEYMNKIKSTINRENE